MGDLKVVYVDIENVIPYENNPRINDDAVEYVVNSIKEFGFKVPIIVDKDNVIIAEHTRLKAAKELGLKTVPVIIAGNLTKQQAKAYRLADNKTGEMAEWEWNKIIDELAKVDGIDMRLLGFTDFLKEDFEGERKQPKVLDGGHEIDLESFDDSVFNTTCPQCGFAFNE